MQLIRSLRGRVAAAAAIAAATLAASLAGCGGSGQSDGTSGKAITPFITPASNHRAPASNHRVPASNHPAPASDSERVSSTGGGQQWSGVGKGFEASDALVLGDVHVGSPSSLKWSCAACSILVVQSDPSDRPALSVAPNDATSGSVPLAAASYHGVVVLADHGAQWAIRIDGAASAKATPQAAPRPPTPSPPGGGTKPASAATSQESVTLSGTVTHPDGAPYPGAYVEARGPNLPDNNIHVTTDANGTYSMMLPAGFYDVVAGDLANLDVGIDVKGGANNEIKVPPSTTMDFVSSA